MSNISEIHDILTQQGDAFQSWKTKQDGKYDELYREVEQLSLKANRPFMGGTSHGNSTVESKALASGFKALLLGQQDRAVQAFVEAKAMSVGSDPDGGYLVHDLISSGMTKVMAEISPVYKLARKVPIPAGAAFEEPVDRDNLSATWVGELAVRADTASPQLGSLKISLHEIYTMPAMSQKLIDTASVDMVAWMIGKIADSFGTTEATAFHTGDGVGKPQGILAYSTAATNDASRAWGTIEHVPTGAAGAFTTTKADCLIDLVSSLKNQYRNGSVWLMNRKTAAAIRKIKESTSDQYIWQPGLQARQPDTLLGFPIELDENMPDIAANSLSIAFGNVARAYTIVEQPGIKVLTDPYTSKPLVKMFAYRRVGAAINNSEAIKLLKFAAA